MTPEKIDKFPRYKRLMEDSRGFASEVRVLRQGGHDEEAAETQKILDKLLDEIGIYDQAKRCAKAEAQRDALVRAIMRFDSKHLNIKTYFKKKFIAGFAEGLDAVLANLKLEAQQILSPDWKDPRKAKCKTCDDSGDVFCPKCNGAGDVYEGTFNDRSPCMACGGARVIPCPTCKGKQR